MADYIVNGARFICDKGETTSVLTIPLARMCLGGKLAANR